MHRLIIPDVVNNQEVCSLAREGTAAEAARQMERHNVAAIVVLGETRKLIGIVTERDLTRRVIAKGLDAEKVTMGQIMSANPDVLAPDDSAGDALEMMRKRNIRHLPVVDGDTMVGMVSIRNLYAAVKEELEEDNKEMEAFVFGDRYGA